MRHDLPCSPDRFWQAFFDPAVVDRMYREALGSTLVEIREQNGDLERGLTRVLYDEQPVDAPGPVKKLIGSSTGNLERGTWGPTAGVWTFQLEPSKLADKITIHGTIQSEPTDGGGVRVFDLEATVKIFGVGKLLESFIQSQTRQAQDATAAWLSHELAEG